LLVPWTEHVGLVAGGASAAFPGSAPTLCSGDARRFGDTWSQSEPRLWWPQLARNLSDRDWEVWEQRSGEDWLFVVHHCSPWDMGRLMRRVKPDRNSGLSFLHG
jgi:hypothetical protein